LLVEPADALYLISYHHNNPVRAKVVTSAIESTWTSHRAYLGRAERPSWLDIELGLSLAGFSADSTAEFDEHVRCHALDVDPLLSGHNMLSDRRALRKSLGMSVEVGSPSVDIHALKLSYPVVGEQGCRLKPRWQGPLGHVLQVVSGHTGVPPEVIRSRKRVRTITHARQLVVVMACQLLGREMSEVARYLNMSPEGARYHVRHGKAETKQTAKALLESLVSGET
jgi:hypothetical protein